MLNSTLCYIEKDGCWLMLYRNKKKNDVCEGKWVGVGGKFEEGESPDQCLLREVREETGLQLTSFKARGVIKFISDIWPAEDMYLYTADGWTGELADCPEGELRWIPKEEVLGLNLWEGDKYFLKPLMENSGFIRMACYYKGDSLVKVEEENSMEKKMKVLSIGAHPDDADTSAGGLLKKLHEKGWEVRLLSVTDGSAGTYKKEMAGAPLAALRRKEAAKSGAVFDGIYDVWDIPDAKLEPTLANRERLIKYIREYEPDLIITNRLNDYHPDHRYTAQLVQDASYLLGVPGLYSEVKAMEHCPVILFWHDSFQNPYPFKPDIIVPIDNYKDAILQCACCHECQYFDWMYWPDHMERADWPREKQVARLKERFDKSSARQRIEYGETVRAKFGDEADNIKHIEVFEISEYGSDPTPEFIALLEK